MTRKLLIAILDATVFIVYENLKKPNTYDIKKFRRISCLALRAESLYCFSFEHFRYVVSIRLGH